MDKFLFFKEGTEANASVNVKFLNSIYTQGGTADTVFIDLEGSDTIDLVRLTVTDGNAGNVVSEIAEWCTSSSDRVLDVLALSRVSSIDLDGGSD